MLSSALFYLGYSVLKLGLLSITLKFDRMKPVYFYLRGPYDQI